MFSFIVAATVAGLATVRDVEIRADGIVFVEQYAGGRTEYEVFPFDFAQADPATPTPLDECVASARVACGHSGIKRIKFSQGPGDQVSCEFECKDGPPPPLPDGL
jgi:hypothetical protein